ncbi:MAG: hypothetical protein ACLQBX_01970 [Candidatus Limnocylindrales bacterium]
MSDDDVLPRLALWLADVAAETALGVQAFETGSRVRDTTPEQEPAARAPR